MSATPEEWHRIENPEPEDDPYADWDYANLGCSDQEWAEICESEGAENQEAAA